jgi:hypothetical protein
VKVRDSTSRQSRRQNLAQGEASAASETLGYAMNMNDRARFSGRHYRTGSCSDWVLLRRLYQPARYRERFCTALWVVLLLHLTFAFVGCNRGIHSVSGGMPGSSPTPQLISSSSDVVTISTSTVQITRNGSADAVMTLSISTGFHVNANPATFSYLIPTEVTAGKVDGITIGKPVYPAAAKKTFQFAAEPLAVYEGEARIKLPLRAEKKVAKGSLSLPIKIAVQACDHEQCFPPATLNATVAVEVK